MTKADVTKMIDAEQGVIKKIQMLAESTSPPSNHEAYAKAILVHAEAIRVLQDARLKESE